MPMPSGVKVRWLCVARDGRNWSWCVVKFEGRPVSAPTTNTANKEIASCFSYMSKRSERQTSPKPLCHCSPRLRAVRNARRLSREFMPLAKTWVASAHTGRRRAIPHTFVRRRIWTREPALSRPHICRIEIAWAAAWAAQPSDIETLCWDNEMASGPFRVWAWHAGANRRYSIAIDIPRLLQPWATDGSGAVDNRPRPCGAVTARGMPNQKIAHTGETERQNFIHFTEERNCRSYQRDDCVIVGKCHSRRVPATTAGGIYDVVDPSALEKEHTFDECIWKDWRRQHTGGRK